MPSRQHSGVEMVTVDPDVPTPVFLYYDPHPVHEKMASYLDAEMVQCKTEGALARIRAGRSHEFGNRPVILEGGVPLVEGAALKLLGSSGPVIALGADSTYHDIRNPMSGRTTTSRLAHRFAQRFVDGTLAVSERIATIAADLTDEPTRVTHPFIKTKRYDKLRTLEPSLDGTRILCLGKYRRKNGQDILVDAISRLNSDVSIDFVGPDTEKIEESKTVTTHGFVSEGELIDLFESSALMVFPAPVGAFPVATLEALCAGLPVVTTPGVGTATLVRGVHGRFVADANPTDIAEAIDWYFSRSEDERKQFSMLASGYGAGFDETSGLEAFGYEYGNLLKDIGYA